MTFMQHLIHVAPFWRRTLAREHNFRKTAYMPAAVCEDGFTVSIQCSRDHYAELGSLHGEPITAVDYELGFPSQEDPLIEEYKDWGGNVYAHVPYEVVRALVEKHGGVVGLAIYDREMGYTPTTINKLMEEKWD